MLCNLYAKYFSMTIIKIFTATLFTLNSICCEAQADSIQQTLKSLQNVSVKYLSAVETKIEQYSNRITGKTERTLTKLSRWETKIKYMLDQISPETSQKLFDNNATTFTTLLKKLQEGKVIAGSNKTRYNEYRDKLTTSIMYLKDQHSQLNKNLIQTLKTTEKKLAELEQDLSNTESVETFIKERKQQLLNEAVKYIGNSKYLKRIDKEAYYYAETLRNYKELFTDTKKTEELTLILLNKIPGFSRFAHENSMLAELFGSPSGNDNVANIEGLQTRASVNTLIQDRLAAGGPNATAAFTQNMQQAQAALTQFKDKVINAGGISSEGNLAYIKPNEQKSKTFIQRLEYGSNFQFAKNNKLLPTTADIALSVGYKLNNKSVIGIGASYKMGLGSIQRLSISHQGLGIRSFIDWKLKKQFFATGAFEMNYNAQFKNLASLQSYSNWQQSGLVGLTKKLNIKTKYFKGTRLQLLFDMLYRQHIPVSQPVLFRVGYTF